ncbi:MAG: D-glycerate dehydrogenase [Alicyclobacillus herbarius]|uniref:2-hydroxyacid dehydrogenase n=1 Tax=Alicyclobacillus herbarius TaxID=122960 RepID=UPI0023566A75|nr:D-glycerate dehydrogenase [Alicyclobacillus herbarius]MCL6632390.1 D-glycerate dehydrogenase [Alicyclobacillus herbarius]
MPSVYVTRRLPEEVLTRLATAVRLSFYPNEDVPVPKSELLARVQGVDGILSLLTDKIDAEVMDAAGPQLKVIANLAVGYDNIDIGEAERRGIYVTNTPDVLTETTADLTFALLMAAARRLSDAERSLRQGKWRAWSLMAYTGVDVFGKCLGIVGMGRIGEAVARRAQGFGMRILYTNRHRRPHAEEAYGATYCSFEELLAQADFVVALAPLTPETRGMFNRDAFRRMKPNAVFVNTARGPIVDEAALVEALTNRQIFAAGLDVFQEEPLSLDHPLMQLDNVVLLPHIGSASIDTRLAMAHLAVDNLLAVLNGQPPKTPVRAP